MILDDPTIINVAVDHFVEGMSHGEIGFKYGLHLNRILLAISISMASKEITSYICAKIRYNEESEI